MSLHSPTQSVVGVRIPKLKVRNRAPGQNGVSHASHASTGTYQSGSSGGETVRTSIPHSPNPSLQASPISPTSHFSPNPSVRVPKIAVRNRAPADEISPESFRFPSPTAANSNGPGHTGQDDHDDIQPIPSPTADSPNRPTLYSAGNDAVSDPYALTERNLASRDSGVGTGWPETPAKRKSRVSGVFGFFSVKEPSAVALEQFAQAQRRQAVLKGGARNTAGLSGMTERPLPAHAPKVNSKWNGLPDWARDVAKEVKKNEKNKSDPLLNKMADNRRPASQSNSVSTLDSNNSRDRKEGHRPSKPSQRPTASRTSSKGSSVQKLRNPSRGRGVPTKKVDGSQQLGEKKSLSRLTSAINRDVSVGAEKANYLLDDRGDSHCPPEPSSATSAGSGMRRPSHTHRRTMSDPRLNIGMDNVATITTFLEDADVSTEKINSKAARLTSDNSASAATLGAEIIPPIPRKSSKRQSSQSNIDVAAIKSSLYRIPTEDSIDSFVTATQELSPGGFPSPPASPRSDVEEIISKADRATSTTPTSKPQMRAIYPPDPAILESIVLASQPDADSPLVTPPEQQIQHKSSLGRISPFPPPHTPRASPSPSRASPLPTDLQQNRTKSGVTSPVPSGLSEQWSKTPQERVGFANPSPVKSSHIVPWEAQDDTSLGARPGTVLMKPGGPTTAGAGASKKTRWSALGKKGAK